MNEQTVEVSIRDIRRLMSQNYLMVNKTLLINLGFNAACWVADMLSKYEYFEKKEMIDERGFFFNIKEDIEASTNLSPYQQTEVIRLLKELDLIEVERRGLPSRNYYRFKIDNLVSYYSKNLTSESQKISQVQVQKFDNINKNKVNKNNEEDKPSVYQSCHSASQNGQDSNSSVVSKATLVRQKAKEIPVVKNGPYKKIFDYWKLSGLCTPKLENSKTYVANVEALHGLLSGELFDRKYTVPEIIKAIDYLKLAISPAYYPTGTRNKVFLKRLYFHQFVFNKITKNSVFNQFLEKPPNPLKEKDIIKPIPDPNPEITTYLKQFYMEKVLGNAQIELTNVDENIFRSSTQKLIEFYENNRGKYPTPWFGIGDVARLYTDAVLDFVERYHQGKISRWPIRNFKWDDFFNKHLPAYMFDQAMLVTTNTQSPLNM